MVKANRDRPPPPLVVVYVSQPFLQLFRNAAFDPCELLLLQGKIHAIGQSYFRRPSCPILCLGGYSGTTGYLGRINVFLLGVSCLEEKILGKVRFNYQVGW